MLKHLYYLIFPGSAIFYPTHQYGIIHENRTKDGFSDTILQPVFALKGEQYQLKYRN